MEDVQNKQNADSRVSEFVRFNTLYRGTHAKYMIPVCSVRTICVGLLLI